MISIQPWIEALPKYQQGIACLCSVDLKVCCLGARMIEEGYTFQKPAYPVVTPEGVKEIVFKSEDNTSYFTMPPSKLLDEWGLLVQMEDLPMPVQLRLKKLLGDSIGGSLAVMLATVNDAYQDDFASVISVLELLVVDEEEQAA